MERPGGGAPKTAAETPAHAGTEVPGYRIDGVIGKGGHGTVYRATATEDGRPAALKVAEASHLEGCVRLAHEARVLRLLGPPHVPAVLADGRLADGSVYLAMELITDPTLSAILEATGVGETGKASASGGLPLPRFARFAHAILDAVEAIHRRAIVHRDLKPANIFLDEAAGLARLVDFGIARTGLHEPVGSGHTETGVAIGTPEFMAPEQRQALDRIDHHADLYAAGVIFYLLLTGRLPFSGSVSEMHHAHIAQRPAAPSRLVPLTSLLDDVVLRALEKEPQHRFPSAAALRDALDQALAQAAATTQRSPKPLPSEAGAKKESKAASWQQRSVMGLVFLESEAPLGMVQVAQSYSGVLAHVAGARCVLAFDQTTSDNPVLRALRVAQALVEGGVTRRAIVDTGEVTVVARKAGQPPRYHAGSFTRADRYPSQNDPARVMVTQAAAALLGDFVLQPLAHRSDLLAVADAKDKTISDLSIAPTRANMLVGREALIAQLIASAQRAIEQSLPTIVTIISEAGHGKSAVAACTLDEIRRSRLGANVVALRAREPLTGSAHEAGSELMRQALQLAMLPPDVHRGPAAYRDLLLSRLPETGKDLWAPLALALGWLAPDAPELRALGVGPGALRQLSARAVGEALRWSAKQRPLLFLLDDAQFADDVLLRAIEHSTASTSDMGTLRGFPSPPATGPAGPSPSGSHANGGSVPLWVCVLARPVFSESFPSWAERAAHQESLPLAPLAQAAAHALCRRLLAPAESIPLSVIDRLYERTQGIPGLILELVRGLKAGGFIRKSDKGDGWYVASEELDRATDVPLAQWLVEREIAGLPPDLAAHCRLAALVGADFSGEEVAGLLRELERDGAATEFPLDARVGLRRLVQQKLLRIEAKGRYRFRTELARTSVARSIPADLRLRIHGAAVRFYEGATDLPPLERQAKIAAHAHGAGDRERAVALYLELGNRSMAGHVYVEADLCYTRAVELLDESDASRRLAALRMRGQVRFRLGRYDDSLNDLEAAGKVAEGQAGVAERADILLAQSLVLDFTNEYHRSRDLAEQVRKLVDDTEDEVPRSVLATLAMAEGRSMMRYSRYTEAQAVLMQAEDEARQLGDEGYETLINTLLMLGPLHAVLGQLDKSEAAFARVFALCEERGDLMHLSCALTNRIHLRLARHEAKEIIADFQRSLAIAQEFGRLADEYRDEQNLAEMCYQACEIEEALKHTDRAEVLGRRLQGDSLRPEVALIRARVLCYRGQIDDARAITDAIARQQVDARAGGSKELLLMPSERALFNAVELATRPTFDRAAWEVLCAEAERDATQWDPAEVWETRGLAAARARLGDEARRSLEQALAKLQGTPNIMEPRVRRALAELAA